MEAEGTTTVRNVTGHALLKRAPSHCLKCQRKASGFSPTFQSGPFERPVPSLRSMVAKGSHMRALVEPPPSSHCDICGGELRLKKIESASRTRDLDNEILVCAKCGREQM